MGLRDLVGMRGRGPGGEVLGGGVEWWGEI